MDMRNMSNFSMSQGVFIVAEAGINHNGDLKTALEMVEVAYQSGVDAIKFQTFKASEFCGDLKQTFEYQSQGKKVTEKMFNLFERHEFSQNEWTIIKQHCDRIGIEFFSTPQNLSDLKMLMKIGINRIKVGSDDLTNINLISKYSEFGLPIILSSGMSDIGDIHNALMAAGWYEGKETSVLICTSLYPTYADQVSISRVSTLGAAFPGLKVGFSDHTLDSKASILACALGATVFEKHFTLDKNSIGPDHWFSCNPSELAEWSSNIRESFKMLGSPLLVPSELELVNKKAFQRSLVAEVDISTGELFTKENVGAMRTDGVSGIPANYFKLIQGKPSKKTYKKGEFIEI